MNYYQPEGWVNISIYDAPQLGQYRVYRDPVYLRGALFLEDLRGLVGDEAFFGTLRDYVQQNAYGLANAEGFFKILSQHTNRDIQPTLEKYFKSVEVN